MKDDWRKAIIGGDVKTIERLLKEDIDFNCHDRYGQTGVMITARNGGVQVLRLLLDKGANTDATAKYNLSALMLVVINRQIQSAMLLVDAGANTRLQGSGAPGFKGKTAYDMALQNGPHDLAAYIARMDKGGDI